MSRVKSLKLTQEQRELVWKVIKESGRKISEIAEQSYINRTHIYHFLKGNKGLGQEKIRDLYSVLDHNEKLQFLGEFAELPSNKKQKRTNYPMDVERNWRNLYDAYDQRLKHRFIVSPTEIRQQLITDLEKLVDKYSSQ